MPYWIDQPINSFKQDNSTDMIKIINSDIIAKKPDLPKGFEIKTLNIGYIDEIHSLLNDHYIEDEQHLARLIYSKDFLYWYLKYIPSGFIVGLIYKQKMVGMVTATFLDMIIYDKEIKVPYINFLCIQKKIRKLGLAEILMNEIKHRISKINIIYAFFTSMSSFSKSFCHSVDYIVPLNYPKLKKVNFLLEDLPKRQKMYDNPLHLMKSTDITSVVEKLNNSMKKYSIKPYFTEDSAKHLLLTKKNIVYSFVNRNNNNIVTDYVSIYKHYLYCIEKKEMVSVAQLAFYFHETMELTDLIEYLLDKLPSYGIDQFIFRNLADNKNIDITKYCTNGRLNYYFYNVCIKDTDASMVCFYPF